MLFWFCMWWIDHLLHEVQENAAIKPLNPRTACNLTGFAIRWDLGCYEETLISYSKLSLLILPETVKLFSANNFSSIKLLFWFDHNNNKHKNRDLKEELYLIMKSQKPPDKYSHYIDSHHQISSIFSLEVMSPTTTTYKQMYLAQQKSPTWSPPFCWSNCQSYVKKRIARDNSITA